MENDWITKPICPKCNSTTHLVKNGIVLKKQRYNCRACGLNFTFNPAFVSSDILTPRQPEKFQKDRLALHLFIEGCSYSKIAELLDMSRPAVVRFLKPFVKYFKHLRNEQKIYRIDLSKGFLRNIRKPDFFASNVIPGRARFILIPFHKTESSQIVVHQEVVFDPRYWNESEEYDHDEDELGHYKKEVDPSDDLEEDLEESSASE